MGDCAIRVGAVRSAISPYPSLGSSGPEPERFRGGGSRRETSEGLRHNRLESRASDSLVSCASTASCSSIWIKEVVVETRQQKIKALIHAGTSFDDVVLSIAARMLTPAALLYRG